MRAMQLWRPSLIPADLAMLSLSGRVHWRCRARGGNQTGIHTHRHDSSLYPVSPSLTFMSVASPNLTTLKPPLGR